MHLKSYQIDGRLLRTGAANFSASGLKQQDNDLVVIESAEAAAAFKREFDANVSKNDIGGVKLGDKASFTVESLPNHPFTGEVTQIGRSPKTYEHVTTDDVIISAPNPDLLLEPGMTATIRIVINRRDHILRAPHPD